MHTEALIRQGNELDEQLAFIQHKLLDPETSEQQAQILMSNGKAKAERLKWIIDELERGECGEYYHPAHNSVLTLICTHKNGHQGEHGKH